MCDENMRAIGLLEEQEMKGKRYVLLDEIRGFALLNMIAYHAIWDLVYIFDVDLPWYKSGGAYLWQQGICWTFILVSGFCWSLGRHTQRRGLIVFMGGVFITVITVIFMPQDRVIFGILTLIGSCMLILGALDRLLRKVSPFGGLSASAILFCLTRNINEGYLGFEAVNIIKLPSILYRNLFTTYLGFPEKGFYSTDYFSLFPWMFLFLAGYFLHKILRDNSKIEIFRKGRLAGAAYLGRHSFGIYMIHQPVLYLILRIFF